MTSPDTPWLLAEPAASVQLLAESDGIWLRGPDLVGGHPSRIGRAYTTDPPRALAAYGDSTTVRTRPGYDGRRWRPHGLCRLHDL